MKIALFTDTFLPQVNGVSLTLERLVTYLHAKGISTHVFAPETSKSDFYAEYLHRFASFPFFLYPECRIAIPNFASVRQVLLDFQPDVIHIATPFNMGLCGLYYSKKFGIPLIASHHTHFDRYLQYYRLGFLSGWIWKYLRWFHATCHTVLVPSAETKRELLQRGFPRVDIWRRGVDADLFHPGQKHPRFRRQYGIDENYICLYAGRLAPEKDLDILAEVIKNMPEPLRSQIHWVIVGDGPLLPELKEAGLPRTTFTGYLNGKALAEAYANADLFVFPSSTETFGNVVLEALASGTPAIGARSGGVQEIIQDGITGTLCTPRSPRRTMEAIAELLSNPNLLRQMSLNARKYALTQSWDSILDPVIMHYKQASAQSWSEQSA
ncbi:glycosyltransferase family 4 protein [Lihuaxuella thermophila]|uniref:Glycosyltransferase involved in cell wall bisynthesis n=1 Tax=Lihuaxuella thermophila TaxID=1173111 RepID=A0A1H8C7R7_9BACL|nr:glycosyltransferase family 1 protein [Lihuaxuella thermophila]SEM91241.1 Glycosyltransferase involved in cell wall bisynthesis [Lihuaxuella thermophila]